MFVPRALKLKGVKELSKTQEEPPRQEANAANLNHGDPTKAPSEEPRKISKGPRFTEKAITPDYLGQLRAGMELMFSDYALQDGENVAWLEKQYRTIEEGQKYLHLSAVLEHSTVSSLRPAATQVLLREALIKEPSPYLELSSSGYYVRRRPSSYPLPFVPDKSFDVANDDGLSFWDQRTIYVEPHLRDFCKTPAKVAHWLQTHGQVREKWLPIQAVHTLYNSCAFVVLSGNVTHEDVWEKWRKLDTPVFWKILTKVEHTKRTNEYLELLAKDNPRMLKQKASPHAADLAHSADMAKNESQRKRKTPSSRDSIETTMEHVDHTDSEILERPSHESGQTTHPKKSKLVLHDHQGQKPAAQQSQGTKIVFED